MENVILTGRSTNGVVLSTIRQASHLDFNVTALGDLCAEMEGLEGTHKILMEKVFPTQAIAENSKVWIDSM